MTEIEQIIKSKIEAAGTPLKDWDIRINRGILTGYNEAFIIDGSKKDELIREDPKSAEIIRPILRGRDIKRYSYNFANLYLITTFPSLHLDIDDYPAIKKHLLSFGYDRLKQTGDVGARKKTSNKWFETQDSIGYWDDFYKPKIMYSEIVQRPQFYFDNKGIWFPEATCFIMSGDHINYLYPLLNSNVITYIYKKYYAGGGLGNTGYRYKKVFLNQLPIPKYNNNIIQKNIISQTYDLNNDIEQLIFSLFNLSNLEIQHIQNDYRNYNMSRNKL